MFSSLPNESVFIQLLHLCKHTKHVVVHDPAIDVQADAVQLLTDVMATRQSIYESLPKRLFSHKGLMVSDAPFFLVLTPGNYEYFVAAFAILSLGAALVPVSPELMKEDAYNFLQRYESTCIVASPQCLGLANNVKAHAASQNQDVVVVSVLSKQTPQPDAIPTTVDEDLNISEERPSIVLSTSGTTGQPKGVVFSRRLFNKSIKDTFGELHLNIYPTHWASGAVNPIRYVLGGARTEILQSKTTTVAAIYERLRKGDITTLFCSSPLWSRLEEYFETNLHQLPADKREQYVRGIQNLRVAYAIGPLGNIYASTEHPLPLMETDDTTDTSIERCIGKPSPGVTAKLSEGDHGEILVKSNYVLSGYLNNEELTRNAFDAEGFFKTGDLAHREGNDYVLDGRASADFARFYGYKILILEVEAYLADLPYISECCILAVTDSKTIGRVAALVHLHDENEYLEARAYKNLKSIREDLSDKLAVYKLPTLLRILEMGEQIPRTKVSEKVSRSQAVQQFFPISEAFNLSAEVKDKIEVWDEKVDNETGPYRKWDWACLREKE